MPTTAPNLSLYNIETELLELLQFREDLLNDSEITPQEQKASIEAVDQQIREYVSREVRKVDNIAGLLREFESREAIAKEEAKRVSDRAKAWAQRKERLESLVISVMRETGATRLDGQNSTLSLKKNPASVDVSQADLLPACYKRTQITIDMDSFETLCTLLSVTEGRHAQRLLHTLVDAKSTPPEPMKAAIADALKCPVCGARAKEREKCAECGGSGLSKIGVPGARLILDNVRLETK